MPPDFDLRSGGFAVTPMSLLSVLLMLGCHDWIVAANGRFETYDPEELAGTDQAEQSGV
jgi:hypothetical protein